MDKYKIDSQKLIYHVPRVQEWLEGEAIYPIYMEISPTGTCNHRCTYCGLDFMEYQPRYLETDILKERLSELGKLGLKSIMYAGEGEPLLHKDIKDIIKYTKNSGIDTAVTTNGVLFKREIADNTLGYMEWIKVGLDGATRETHAKIHRCSGDDFDKTLSNIIYAARLKRKEKYACALGMQFLLLPENSHEVVALAKMARDMGLDYLVVKPYSQHIQSKTTMYSSLKYSDYAYLADELAKFSTADFNIIFRIHTMKKWDEKRRNYKHCLALPFWSYIDAGGNVWGCSVYLGDKKFLYGNIYEESFQKIWEGKKRSQSLRWIEEGLDISGCRVNCRMDEINEYLWELKNLPEHVNFI
ncbi:MAG: radical SAM protein [Candidatus Omnitrophota bacterium]|nr:MAG: radical SAM protein [Candidatus Omnitrophota bacterium]